MRVPRALRWVLAGLVIILLVAGLLAVGAWTYLHPRVARTNGLVYGQRHGRNLTVDVVRPSHGNADTLVPLDQSQRFQAEARKLGDRVELVVIHGGRHGWLTMVWDVRRFADWFDRHLRPGSESRL